MNKNRVETTRLLLRITQIERGCGLVQARNANAAPTAARSPPALSALPEDAAVELALAAEDEVEEAALLDEEEAAAEAALLELEVAEAEAEAALLVDDAAAAAEVMVAAAAAEVAEPDSEAMAVDAV